MIEHDSLKPSARVGAWCLIIVGIVMAVGAALAAPSCG